MVSIPIAVCAGNFGLQLDLFWHQHQKVYGVGAWRKAVALVVDKNAPDETSHKALPWRLNLPHVIVKSCFDFLNIEQIYDRLIVPLNIQSALIQTIGQFDDDEIIELLDCDMCHLKKHPHLNIKDEVVVSNVYESWHLKSLSEHKHLIEPLLTKHHGAYNGGFVPIIAKAKTFKKILITWLQAHKQIFQSTSSKDFKWWAGMYALQVACANHQVVMRHEDVVYVPGFNEYKSWHYISHYSCDSRFNKKIIKSVDDVDFSQFLENDFYRAVKSWVNMRKENGYI
jgi:hypothetical protein